MWKLTLLTQSRWKTRLMTWFIISHLWRDWKRTTPHNSSWQLSNWQLNITVQVAVVIKSEVWWIWHHYYNVGGIVANTVPPPHGLIGAFGLGSPTNPHFLVWPLVQGAHSTLLRAQQGSSWSLWSFDIPLPNAMEEATAPGTQNLPTCFV